MNEDLDKQERIERQKTIRMAMVIVLALILCAVLFGFYRFVTAPVRAVETTTETITRSVEETATAVLTRRHIRVKRGRAFSRHAEKAHALLIDLPVSEPAGFRDRVFRMSHLRGSQNRVCRFEMDFGNGPIPVWAAADNAEFETNRDLGGDAHRQVRIVFETNDLIIGVSVEYDAMAETPLWQLLWRRRDSLDKPMTDAIMSERAISALAAIPDECSPPV